MAVANALLLMSSWYSASSRLEAIRWSTTAISMMDSITQYGNFNNREALTEDPQVRRLWWSCFIRDQSIALGLLQRPIMAYAPQIMPIISMADFKFLNIKTQKKLNAASSHTPELLIPPALARERLAATIFIEMAKQSTFLNRVLILRMDQPPKGASSLNTLTDVILGESELWYRKLPAEIIYSNTRKTAGSIAQKENTEPSMIHCGLLEIMHSLTQMTVHDMRRRTTINGKSGSLFRKSAASAAAVQVLQDYSRIGSTHHLTTHVVELVLPLVISKFLKLEAVRRNNTEACLDGFGKGLEIWKEFCEKRLEQRSQHDFKSEFLDHILQSMPCREDNKILFPFEEDDAIPATDSTEAPMSYVNHVPLSAMEAVVEESGDIMPESAVQSMQDYSNQNSEAYTPSWPEIFENDFNTLFNLPG